ncbi:cell division protein SepF [Lachnospiraceae bacterium 29-84]
MGKFINSFMGMMHIAEAVEDDDDDDDGTEEYYEEIPRKGGLKSFFKPKFDEDPEDEEGGYEEDPEDEEDFKASRRVRNNAKITPMRATKRQGLDMELCVVKPTSMAMAREVSETLLKDKIVLLDVEGLDFELAQRIIDFASGSCFAIGGNLEKVSNYIFIMSPRNVPISGDYINSKNTDDDMQAIQSTGM